MCLTLKFKTRFCVSYDILVFKMLDNSNPFNIITPYQKRPVRFNDGVSELWIHEEDLKPSVWNNVNQGIHSFFDVHWCRQRSRMCNTMTYYAIIPAGVPFYVGIDFDVVSSRLLIFETAEDLNRYEEKNGKASPLMAEQLGNWMIPEGKIVRENGKISLRHETT